jgi:hypothetical protein
MQPYKGVQGGDCQAAVARSGRHRAVNAREGGRLLYWGEVDAAHKAAPGGGLEHEGEETEVVVIPFDKALAMVERGEIQDAKTIVGIQHLALLNGG